MKIFEKPEKDSWEQIIKRPILDSSALYNVVKPILTNVRQNGDAAIKAYNFQFDGADTAGLLVAENDIKNSGEVLDKALKMAINQAAENIELFHQRQVVPTEKIETMPGVFCWRKSVGISKIGIYIPGGSAPLFSTVLMLGLPAKIAGCNEIVLCTPPQKDGSIHPAILYAAQVAGVTRIVKTGGAQAIAALAYGTETVPKVHKIFGPGNQYVTTAKQLVQIEGVAIDMPAGPSEVCVMADYSANPAYVAADLLSQAEHGADSQVLLIASTRSIVTSVQNEIEKQLLLLPRKEIAKLALQNSLAITMDDTELMIELVNKYAPEHLIICMNNAEEISHKIKNAGSIFLGNFSPESVGDYASGTNHALPTNGYAAMYSGVSVDSFVKKITVQHLTEEGLANIAFTVTTMAEAEGLQAHSNAVKIRLSAK